MGEVDWNNLESASKEAVSEAFITATLEQADELITTVPHKISPKAMVMASEKAIQESDYDKIRFLAKNNMFKPIKGVKLIGFANYVGQWSADLIKSMEEISGAKVIAIPLSREDTESPELLAIFNGFINPGAGDTFPGPEPFDISYMAPETGDHMAHEYAYQNVINYAIEHNVPYLGICNGVQHLILNQGGSIAKAATQHNGVPHSIIMVPGTIAHFLALSKEEQYLALGQSYFEAMEFAINTQHNYAGVEGKLESLELGGRSDQNVVETVAKNFYQYGFQFHPENMFRRGGEAGERNLNLLQNTFKNFLQNRDEVNLDLVHQYLANALEEAFTEAKCYYQPNVTPKSDMFQHDVYQAAIQAGRRESYVATPEAALAALKVEGNKLLMMAIAEDNVDLLNLALDNGIELDKQNFMDFTPHAIAAMTGSKKCLERLLKDKPLSNLPDGGYEVLQIAIDNNQEELALTLINNHGAVFQNLGDTTISPVQLAIIKGMPKIVDALINKGIDVNQKAHVDIVNGINSESRDTELSVAEMIKANWSAEMVLQNLDLIDKLPDKSTIIGENFLLSNIKKVDKETLQRLIAMGADINALDYYEISVLATAIKGADISIISTLLDNGIIKNSYLAPPLYFAVIRGDEKIVALLIEYDATAVNARRYYNGKSLLHIAVGGGNEAVVKMLLANGAIVGAEDKNNETPLHDAARKGNNVIIETLLQNGASINAVNSKGETALHFAVAGGDIEVIKLLLSSGINIYAKTTDGRTAIDYSNSKEIRVLIEDHIKEQQTLVTTSKETKSEPTQTNNAQASSAANNTHSTTTIHKVPLLTPNNSIILPTQAIASPSISAPQQQRVSDGSTTNQYATTGQYKGAEGSVLEALPAIVNYLLGGYLHGYRYNPPTPLHKFAYEGNVSEMIKCIKKTPEAMKARGERGETPFQLYLARHEDVFYDNKSSILLESHESKALRNPTVGEAIPNQPLKKSAIDIEEETTRITNAMIKASNRNQVIREIVDYGPSALKFLSDKQFENIFGFKAEPKVIQDIREDLMNYGFEETTLGSMRKSIYSGLSSFISTNRESEQQGQVDAALKQIRSKVIEVKKEGAEVVSKDKATLANSAIEVISEKAEQLLKR